MTDPTSQYEVGYGKPPHEHQWKPGQSGNPAGRRRKKAKRTPTDLVDGIVLALLADHEVVIDNKKRKMPAYEIVCHGLVRDLLKAQGKDRLSIIRCLEMLGVFEELKTTRQMMASEYEPIFTDEDQKWLAQLSVEIEEQVKLDPEAWASDADSGEREA